MDVTETLREFGYQPIVSDAQAAQLLRRELKHHRQWQQRDKTRSWNMDNLLSIKRGNWFKFIKNHRNGHCAILIWHKPTRRKRRGHSTTAKPDDSQTTH